jgi:5'-AMP-activated protein kinase, catalytic alpha subunit
VRLGTHLITGEKVAIKILEKDKIKDQSDVERVTREIHILKIVRHPNVIQLYEVSSFASSNPLPLLDY